MWFIWPAVMLQLCARANLKACTNKSTEKKISADLTDVLIV